MLVSIKIYADISNPYNGILELPEESTVEDALTQVDLVELQQMTQHNIVVLVNQKNAGFQDILQDGDKLLVLQSMAGG